MKVCTNRLFAGLAALFLVCTACVKVNGELGSNFIPRSDVYDVFVEEFNLRHIDMKQASKLSGYSNQRITVGAVRDEVFGLTCKSSAFTYVPLDDTLDFGSNAVFKSFGFTLERDTVSAPDAASEHIMQNIRVFALEDAGIILDSTKKFVSDITRAQFRGKRTITRGTPVYAGGDSLNFHINNTYGQELIDRFTAGGTRRRYIIDTLSKYTREFPGVLLTCDEPTGLGGRFNLFKLNLDYTSSDYVVNGNFAELFFSAEYGGVRKDTSFLFIFGPDKVAESVASMPTQYAFNVCQHEGLVPEGEAVGRIYLEGGGGLKPVISSEQLRAGLMAALEKHGADPAKTIINRASIILPVENPSAEAYRTFPRILSPCCCLRSQDTHGTRYATFINLTDASVSTENQGRLNRHSGRYEPDVAFHLQQMLKLKDNETDSTFRRYDLWMLAEADETVTVQNTTSAEDDYYNQMAYYSYLNSLYGGGYGGYSNYGYGYNNYYSMMYYYSMLGSSSGSSTTSYTVQALDKDRYYRAFLKGPSAGGDDLPHVRLVFSVPKG